MGVVERERGRGRGGEPHAVEEAQIEEAAKVVHDAFDLDSAPQV